jgi:hypothetical protein
VLNLAGMPDHVPLVLSAPPAVSAHRPRATGARARRLLALFPTSQATSAGSSASWPAGSGRHRGHRRRWHVGGQDPGRLTVAWKRTTFQPPSLRQRRSSGSGTLPGAVMPTRLLIDQLLSRAVAALLWEAGYGAVRIPAYAWQPLRAARSLRVAWPRTARSCPRALTSQARCSRCGGHLGGHRSVNRPPGSRPARFRRARQRGRHPWRGGASRP